MRVPTSPAEAPADRRLFEPGSSGFGVGSEWELVDGVGLKVGRHIGEQF